MSRGCDWPPTTRYQSRQQRQPTLSAGPRLAACVLLGPSGDLWPKPQPSAATPALNRGAREVLIAAHVGRHAVSVTQTEDICDLLGVDEVIDVNGRCHARQST